MRLTRAALRAGAEQDDASNVHTDLKERVPLSEVSVNTALDVEVEGADTEQAEPKKMPARKTKGRTGAKKGAKSKKATIVEDEQDQDVQVVLDDERQLAGSPASDAAADDLTQPRTNGKKTTVRQCDIGQLTVGRADIVQVPMNDERSSSPPSRAVRMTRRQLAMQEEQLSKSQRLAAPPNFEPQPEPEPTFEEVDHQPSVEQDEVEDVTVGAQEAEVVEVQDTLPVDATPNTDATKPSEVSLIEDEEAIPEPSETATTVQVQEASSESSSLTADSTKPTDAIVPKDEDVFQHQEAADMETAEAAATEITTPGLHFSVEPEPKTLTSEKPCESDPCTPATSRAPSRSPSKSPARSPMRLEESFEAIDALEVALENVVPTINPAADDALPEKPTIGMVKPLKVANVERKSSMVAPRYSRNLHAVNSLKPMAAPKSTLARSSSTRAVPSKSVRKGSGEVADYLASKRRPVSVSFPTPPPPPKGKPPTKPTFHLSSESVAAKLKVQKEERLRREAEGRPANATFVPPQIKSSKPPTKATFTLSSDAVAAKLKTQKEERLKREADGVAEHSNNTTFQAPAPPKSSKPPTVPNFQLPGEAVAAKLKAQKEERLRREAEGLTGRSSSVAFHAPAPPKSSKAPTVPSFTLPGEAVAAKLKAQREERVKREEEEDNTKKTAFKARPVPVHRNGAAIVRQKAANKTRESLMNGDMKENVLPTRTGSIAGKRNSTIVPRSTFGASATGSSNLSKRNSVLVSKAITANDVNTQRLKGREVFNRDKLEKEQRDKEKHEKEEAAKKARAEAAERSRVLSREWAAKQKQKAMGAAQKIEAA
jgi:hypothetical protein